MRFVSSVCQSVTTTVLDPQRHSTQQLWTKLWERLDDRAMERQFQQREIQVKDECEKLFYALREIRLQDRK